MQHLCADAMAWLTSSKHAHPHMCYGAEFGRSALKGVHENLRNWEPWNSALLGGEA